MHSKFSSPLIQLIVIILVAGLLLYNLMGLFTTGNLKVLLPIALQSVLCLLILIRHQYLALGIKIWALFFIGVGCLRIFSAALQSITSSVDLEGLLWGMIKLGLGLILFKIAQDEIEVSMDSNEPDPDMNK